VSLTRPGPRGPCRRGELGFLLATESLDAEILSERALRYTTEPAPRRIAASSGGCRYRYSATIWALLLATLLGPYAFRISMRWLPPPPAADEKSRSSADAPPPTSTTGRSNGTGDGGDGPRDAPNGREARPRPPAVTFTTS
jgi:hypothetical protein